MKTNQLLTQLAVPVLMAPTLLADPLSNNDYDDFNPQVSGDIIVWQAFVPDAEAEPDDSEIFLKYKGGETVRVTDNTGDDENIKISGSSIVWQSWDGTDFEIWIYNADTATATQLTDNDTDDINPSIDGTTVVWQAWDGTDYEIESTSVAAMIPVEIGLRITPRSLNLRSNGKWVSATLDVGDIDPSTVDPASILLQDSIPAEKVSVNGSALKMKFDRQALQALFSGAGNVEVTVTAETTGGDVLTGTDTIRTIP
ncbi:TolB family protein [Luteolibacter marinus]|uniref:TolB family protein n=1 Tax=Luteolibacter marinus TaxID=2776705 RepID=UPI00186940F2|nr:hypothetical protein [Luteolibacter marinus]